MKGEYRKQLYGKEMDESKLLREFGILNRIFISYSAKEIVSQDLSYSDSIFLVNIGVKEGSTQEEISTLLAIDKAAIARSVKHLVKEEYVRVERPDRDKRAKQLYLTGKGKDCFFRILQSNAKILAYVLQDFSNSDREEFCSQIEKIEIRAREYLVLEKNTTVTE